VRLVARAPGKVNLCLFLGPVRSDGRHELVTLFESVSLADEVSLEVAGRGRDEVSLEVAGRGRDEVSLEVAGRGRDEVVCPGVEGPNLAAGALEGLRERGWRAPAVVVAIRKRIPVAAGMGGGSGDAAAVLRLASAVAPVASAVLGELAAELGADVPSQLTPGLVLGTGAGEMVEAAEPLAPHALVIVPQPFGLSTAEVYREADRLGLPRSLQDLAVRLAEVRAALVAGARLPAELLVDDLEAAALSLRPEIGTALEAVRASGASPAMVSGSGPTVFGVYWGEAAPERAAAAAEALADRYPGVCSVVPVAAGFGNPVAA
jgi:4-diphosphocytidyl-2-C-methyl-D-erythritol kinase